MGFIEEEQVTTNNADAVNLGNKENVAPFHRPWSRHRVDRHHLAVLSRLGLGRLPGDIVIDSTSTQFIISEVTLLDFFMHKSNSAVVTSALVAELASQANNRLSPKSALSRCTPVSFVVDCVRKQSMDRTHQPPALSSQIWQLMMSSAVLRVRVL
jgi:hypothetical protein